MFDPIKNVFDNRVITNIINKYTFDNTKDKLFAIPDNARAFTKDSFKKMLIDKSLNTLLDYMRDVAYRYNQKKYAEPRPFKYRHMLTIMRHMCKHANISYETQFISIIGKKETIMVITPNKLTEPTVAT